MGFLRHGHYAGCRGRGKGDGLAQDGRLRLGCGLGSEALRLGPQGGGALAGGFDGGDESMLNL